MHYIMDALFISFHNLIFSMKALTLIAFSLVYNRSSNSSSLLPFHLHIAQKNKKKQTQNLGKERSDCE